LRALYDVNVLLALFDAEHISHNSARLLHRQLAKQGWLTCALTENGFLRIISQPSYTNPIPTGLAAARLNEAKLDANAGFIPCDISIGDPERVDATRLLGPKTLTDIYLLALAVAHDATFVTFDRRVALASVIGAKTDHLLVI
jgi:uncharacterized protein